MQFPFGSWNTGPALLSPPGAQGFMCFVDLEKACGGVLQEYGFRGGLVPV